MSKQSGSERTEKPTQKRKEKAREEGQIARSNELNIAFSVIMLFAVLYIVWDRFVESASGMVSKYLSSGFLADMSVSLSKTTVMSVYKSALTDALKIIWPILLLAMLFGVLIHVAQTGFLLTGKALKPKMSRISPLEGFKRIFSTRSLIELFKSSVKVVFLVYLVYTVYTGIFAQFPEMMKMDVKEAFLQVMHTALKLGIQMGAVLAAVAAVDYFYQRKRHEKDLMMTKQEVKEEYKQLEGDPQIKGRIRQKQRQMSRLRMMQRLPEADVVITNPTHYAVAIRYKDKVDKAPVVLAKGKDQLALRIKEKAREHGIEIVENRPVAQALYKNCELDEEIPKELYQAVAEILVYVYRMKNKTVKGVHR
jgi:flagellar biosynthetic protein FlhB